MKGGKKKKYLDGSKEGKGGGKTKGRVFDESLKKKKKK